MAYDQLAVHLSGGASNTDRNASLGGAMSTVTAGYFSPQSFTWVGGAISGITIVSGWSTPTGDGLFTYTHPNSVTWTPNGGMAHTIPLSGDGLYRVGLNGRLLLSVQASSLPGTTTVKTVTVADREENLFDDVSDTERQAGDVEYRCIWVKNYGSKEATGLVVTIGTDPTNSDLAIGSEFFSSVVYVLSILEMEEKNVWDHYYAAEGLTVFGSQGSVIGEDFGYFVGAGASAANDGQTSDGSTGDLPYTLADESDSTNQLQNVVWGTSLSLGSLPSGQCMSFWIKRTVPVLSATPHYDELGVLTIAFSGD